MGVTEPTQSISGETSALQQSVVLLVVLFPKGRATPTCSRQEEREGKGEYLYRWWDITTAANNAQQNILTGTANLQSD